MTAARPWSSLYFADLVGIGLVILGGMAPWLRLPLSAPTSGLHTPLGIPLIGPLTAAGLVFGFVLLALVGRLLRRSLLQAVGVSGGLLVPLAFALQVAANSPAEIGRYLVESEQRTAIESFLKRYYWPNVSEGPTFLLIDDFEYLTDRFLAVWDMLGWGWLFVVFGTLLLLARNLAAKGQPRGATIIGLLMIALLILASGFPALAAEVAQRRGDLLFATGRPSEALGAYERALDRDRTLALSHRFLVKASRAIYQIEGPNASAARLFAVGQESGLASIRRGAEHSGSGQGLGFGTRRALLDYSPPSGEDGALPRAIAAQSAKERVALWVEEGAGALSAGRFAEAASAFQEAARLGQGLPFPRLALGHTLLQLGKAAEAVEIFEVLGGAIRYRPVLSDMRCMLGDALHRQGHLAAARSAYKQCLELDSVMNLRAVRSLGGT